MVDQVGRQATSSEDVEIVEIGEIFEVGKELDHYTHEFVGTLLDDVRRHDLLGEARLIDRDEKDILLVYPDGTQVFVGRDETASNAGIFGFTVTPGEPVPYLGSVSEALDLLQPVPVAERLQNGDVDVLRQGEWFFVPAQDEPESKVFKCGVGSRPYGYSPLQNHVPRDYCFGASEEDVMNWIEEELSGVLDRIDDFEGLIEALSDRHQWHWISSFVGRGGEITLQELYREVFDGVYVRGTIRHRRKDHSMLSLGEQWHEAYTHGLDVRSAGQDQLYD